MAIDLVTKFQPYVDEKFTTESKRHSLPTQTLNGQEPTQLKYIRSAQDR